MTAIDFPDWNVSAPAAGVTWQQIFPTTLVGASSIIESPFFYVGNFETVIINTSQNVAQAAIWQVNWLDHASYLEFPLWTDQFFKDTTGQVLTALTVKSPLMYFSVNNQGASSMNAKGFVNGGLGESGPGVSIMAQVIQDATSVSVPASSTTFQGVANSIAGPATLWAESGVTGLVRLQRWNGSAWIDFLELNTNVTAGAEDNCIIPPDDIRIGLTNTSAGAGNFFYSLVHGG